MTTTMQTYAAETIELIERFEDQLRAAGRVLDRAKNDELSARQKADLRRIAQQMRVVVADVQRARAKRN